MRIRIKMLSIIASLFTCSSMSIYVYRLVKTARTLNPTTWIIWFIVGLMNLFTYTFVLRGNLIQVLPLLFVMTGITFVTIYSIIKGRFSKLRSQDYLCLSMAVIIGFFWKFSGNAKMANLLLQSIYVISFVPTILGLRNGTLKETVLPWLLAFIAYALMIIVILLNWENQSWIALVHPMVNGLIGNGFIIFFAAKQQISLPKKFLCPVLQKI